MSAMYKNWMFVFSIQELHNEFIGEVRNFGDKDDYILLTYKYRNLNLGVGMSRFLDRDYKTNRQKICNKYIPSSQWSIEANNLLVFKLSYSFFWGKQKESYNQRVKNEDTNRGIDVLK